MATLELTEQEADQILQTADVIRDPLHGDVALTGLERRLIDSSDFQRLRNINQLAMTYVAYPGAVHTRFIHSIGTLHVCSTMIDTCNKNAKEFAVGLNEEHPIPLQINGHATVLARLCALLHDLAHVPFGHTFEKEAKIFKRDEWKDEKRSKKLLGPDSNVAKTLEGAFELFSIDTSKAQGLLTDIRAVLTTDRASVSSLKYPFVHDLVGNTVCADLIDYVQRDMYFCGLVERFGDRFLKYLAVVPMAQKRAETGEAPKRLVPITLPAGNAFATRADKDSFQFCRVVLLGYRYNEMTQVVMKPDVFGEAIDLVRKRLTVARKLYFHRTKLVASAMLSEAAFAHGFKSAEEIWEKSDQEVLKHFQSSESESTRRLASNLLERKLFKTIYRCSHHEDDGSEASKTINKARDKYLDPKIRHELVDRLERLIGYMVNANGNPSKGGVVVSCPDKDMGLKGFDMLILSEPTDDVHTLQESKHKSIKAEIKAIHDTHRFLWRLEVFVDSNLIPPKPTNVIARELAVAVQCEIGPPNEVQGFASLHGKDLDQLEDQYILQRLLETLGVSHEIKHDDLVTLRGTALRSDSLSPVDTEAVIREQLKLMGYRPKASHEL